MVSVMVGPDDKNSSVNILQVWNDFRDLTRIRLVNNFYSFQVDQLSLALPSREYYLKPSSKADLAAYHKYMTQIAIIIGAQPDLAEEEMQEVLDFEILLANVRFLNTDHIFFNSHVFPMVDS